MNLPIGWIEVDMKTLTKHQKQLFNTVVAYTQRTMERIHMERQTRAMLALLSAQRSYKNVRLIVASMANSLKMVLTCENICLYYVGKLNNVFFVFLCLLVFICFKFF